MPNNYYVLQRLYISSFIPHFNSEFFFRFIFFNYNSKLNYEIDIFKFEKIVSRNILQHK